MSNKRKKNKLPYVGYINIVYMIRYIWRIEADK